MPSSSTRASSESENATRERILDVAVEEFSSKGFGSVRIDSIAARANANKQLIYYYFSSKSGLYDAVLDRLVDTYRPVWAAMREGTLDDMIRLRAEQARGSITWRRLLAWEGLEYWANRDNPIHREDIRKAAYDSQREVLEHAQQSGAFPADVDARFASLLLIFASLGPVAFPQITKLVTGLEPDDPAVADGVDQVIAALLARASEDQRPSGPSQ
ncbi:TetR/AcrR family transcriptional regulator [Nocardia fusca]|uniref:TetR/AcrR family transcriptional regulator n=1 Tax=Nocardia fusca TaxID=941183 RepID=UPI0037A8F40F